MKRNFVELGLIVGLALVGCDKKVEVVAAPSTGTGEVLVSVGGARYTKGDLERDIEFRMRYYKYMDPKCTDQTLSMVRMKAVSQLIPAFIQNAIVSYSFDRYVETNGVMTVPVAAIRKEIEEQYVKSKPGLTDFAALQADMKKLGIERQFLRNINFEVKTEALLRNSFTNLFPIGEEEIRQFHKGVKLTNADSVKTNALIAVAMTNVIKALKTGGDFNQLQAKYDMTPDFAKEEANYEWIQADFKDMPGVWEKLLSMKIGETTDVLDAVDSWHIYRVDEIIPPNKSQSGEDAFHLSRIYFRRAGTFDPYTDDEVRNALAPIRREKMLEFITAFEIPNLAIKYPNGTEFIKSKEFEKLNGFIERIREFYKKLDEFKAKQQKAKVKNAVKKEAGK